MLTDFQYEVWLKISGDGETTLTKCSVR